MEVLSNREWALVFWITVLFAYILVAKNMDSAREALKAIISAFFVRQILSVLFLMLMYMGVMIYALSEQGLWDSQQIKNTIIWCASIGLMSLFKMQSIKEGSSFFKHLVLDSLKLVAILEFVVGVYPFNFFVEIVLIPILTIIGAMIAIAESDDKHQLVKKILDSVLAIFGVIVISYTIFMLFTEFDGIAKKQTVYDFLIPPLLTLLYLPFIFFMVVYTSYQQVIIRINYFINKPILKYLAIIYSIIVFNFRIKALERWATSLAFSDTDTHKGIINSIKHVLKILKSEKRPPIVLADEGWSPYIAKEFLTNEGFKTGYYNKSFDEWYSSSPMIEFGNGLIPDNIAYYVEGSEKVANRLKLKLNVNDSNCAEEAHQELLQASKNLFNEAVNESLPAQIIEGILSGNPVKEKVGTYFLSIEKDIWPNHAFSGYDIKFIISSI